MSLSQLTDTRLGKACRPLVEVEAGRSGIIALADGHDAFAARALLANAADRTLDVQYYIWHQDMSGTLLFGALVRAADRGVRLRLLLDDNNTVGLDTVLAAFDTHPNVEVRLFNPFRFRRWRMLNYLTEFSRLNRRMHNKSFTADGQATIIGGRNIGDEYFDAGRAPWFVDLDVLAIGPVVSDVSADFERYWTSAASVPAARVVPKATPQVLAEVTADVARVEHNPAAVGYTKALAQSPLVQDLLAGGLTFEWAGTRMISDDPAKVLGRAPRHTLLWPRLRESIGTPTDSFRLVSPYFVPGKNGVLQLATMTGQGVKVEVLTNALESTDVAPVHAGYAKWRKSLLKAGIALFELKRASPTPSTNRRKKRSQRSGSSGSSLHAKTFSVDNSRVFVGSFNFDPRSARFNTEMGFVIDSPTLAKAMVERFIDEMPDRAYRVLLDEAGRLQWIERVDGTEVTHHREPGAGFWRRVAVSVLSVLPIEWLL